MRSYPVIDMEKTGRNLQLECELREISTKELQQYLGLSSRQSIYSWFQGKALPNLDNLYALSRYLGVAMEDFVIQKKESLAEGDLILEEQPYGIDVRALERRQLAYFGGLLQMA